MDERSEQVILKKRTAPLNLLKVEALRKRLSNNHTSFKSIEDEESRLNAGFIGEKSLNYPLSFLSKTNYAIFHGLRLKNEYTHFQLDTLILSSNFYMIVEVKNYAGTIFFDKSFGQITRKLNGKEDGFQDPILQVKRQRSNFITWLKEQKQCVIPIEYLVVISNPRTIIKAAPDYTEPIERVTISSNFNQKFLKYEERYKSEKVDRKEIKRISGLLLKKHEPLDSDILTQFQVLEEEILTGVHCPSCSFRPMERERGKWKCKNCLISSKDAHLEALKEYSLLFESTISNNQMRSFLHLSSEKVASSLLKSSNFPYSGNGRSRIYHLPIIEN